MTALKLIMTTAGLGRFTAAQADDDIDLTIASVGLTAAAFVAAPTLTDLPGEFRRLTSVSGSVEAQDIVHLTVTDDEAVTYSVTGFGLFLADGTLFAAYSQPGAIAEKSSGSMMALAIDIAFPVAGVEQLTFGPTNFLNPPGTEARKGVVELATFAEAQAGDALRVTTGAVVKAMIADVVAAVIEAVEGLAARTIYGSGLVKGGGRNDTNRTLTVDAATGDDVRDGTALDMAVTPAALAAAGVIYVVRSNLAAQAGYREWSDGYIEQWGYVDGAVTGEPAIPIAFAIPFKEECFGVSGTVRNTAQSTSGSHLVQEVSVSLNGAVVFLQSDNSNTQDAAGGFRWRATGR
ncbi:hypothetical protein [uncultured Sphingomonas sp.]|uniref:gp53-like domain-containing protein n=1 Tax=uncultured Sphingomonas sp. TaxID=158754 RepID=UPI00261CFC81|nr:hypothetical protein [uncultured Sphingomonas sp.]